MSRFPGNEGRVPMAQVRRFVGGLALMALLSTVLRGQDGDTAALVAKAGGYLKTYEQQLTAIVGEEHQVQRVVSPNGAVIKTRELVSDVMLVRQQLIPRLTVLMIGGDIGFFRDVSTVDGRPVRNRES